MGIPLRPSFSSSFIHVKLALFLIYLFLNWDFLAKMPIERSNVNNIVGRFEGKEKKEHFNAREGDSWAPIALSHIQDIFPKHSCGISSGLSATLGTMYTYEWVIWSCPWELTVLQVGLRTNDYWKKNRYSGMKACDASFPVAGMVMVFRNKEKVTGFKFSQEAYR